jgi:hypothetical protein
VSGRLPFKVYAGALGEPGIKRTDRFTWTGHFRAPLRGEFYLSGAIPEVYRAENDLGQEFHIMQPARPEDCACRECGRAHEVPYRPGPPPPAFLEWLDSKDKGLRGRGPRGKA